MAKLVCYRGESTVNWGDADIRLISGLTVRKPWGARPPKFVLKMADVWSNLTTEMKKEKKTKDQGIVAAFAQTLRKEGKVYALATARTKEGSYETKGCANYMIEIPNARIFRWVEDKDKNLSLGAEEASWLTDLKKIDADYIVLNADTIEKSTVFGFGHKTGTYEVTFFTDLPTAWIKTVDGKDVSKISIKKKEDLTMDQKTGLMRDLLR